MKIHYTNTNSPIDFPEEFEMNTLLTKLALDSHLINYIDHETPRVYFICGHADIEDVQKFADSIIHECLSVLNKRYMGDNNREDMEVRRCIKDVKKHFGL